MQLSLTVTDLDLAALLKAWPVPPEITGLAAEIHEDGIHVSGRYRFLIPFDTRWTLATTGSRLVATLAEVRAIGVPLAVLKGHVLGALSGPRLQVQGDQVLLDLSQPYVPFTLTDVETSAGQLRLAGH